jgi:hypothetical protein
MDVGMIRTMVGLGVLGMVVIVAVLAAAWRRTRRPVPLPPPAGKGNG